MITVTVRKDGGKIIAFSVEGHSGYSEAGSDIVCAGASAVTWSTIYGLCEAMGVPASVESRDGYAACNIPPLSDEKRRQADILLQSFLAFMQSMQEQYSEFLRITEV